MKSLRFSKVDKDTKFGISDSHVIEQLCPVFIQDFRHGFQFNYDIIVTHKVGFISFLQLNTMKIHFQHLLPFPWNVLFRTNHGKTLLIDRFGIIASKFIVEQHRRSYDLVHAVFVKLDVHDTGEVVFKKQI